MHEPLPAVLTLERILLRVTRYLVILEMLLAVKPFAALWMPAFEQRMLDVLGRVLLEFVFTRKCHVTLDATERSHVGVTRERVTFEVESRLEGHCAEDTSLVLVAVV